MTVPALSVYQNNGDAVSADNLNSFIQTAQTAAQLRTLIGIAGMAVMLQGIATPGDGLAGTFYWNGAASISDDGVNTLVPYGAPSGAWMRANQPGGGGGGAPLNSPAFTGIPTAPTAAVGTSTDQLATTAFVNAQGFAPLASPTFTGTVTIPAGASISGYALSTAIPAASSTTPTMDGTAAIGSLTTYARGDHVHPTDTSRAPIASPTFTGTVTIPAGASISGYALSTAIPAASSTTPAMDGTATIGVGTTYARADHIHPTDTSRAPTASPTFTGTVTLPAGSTTVQPIKMQAGSLLTTAVAHSIEWDGSNLYATNSGATRNTLAYTSAIPSASSTTPAMDGTAAVGVGTTWARADHVHPTDTSRAPLASPTFTGTVTIPAGASISGYALSTAIPAASSTTPAMDGTAAIGVGTTYARADHVHPTDTSRAPLASPTFTGTVTIPTGASISGYALTSSVPAASSTSPAMDALTASIGSATTYARADHIHPSDMPAVSTIASLRSQTTTTLPASRCVLTGYSTIGDGGDGVFFVNASDTTSADNGGTIIVDSSSRRWYRSTSGVILRAAWFGCVGDGTTDNAAAYARALAALPSGGGAVVFGAGKFRFNSQQTYSYPTGKFALILAGAGADATVLYWPSTGGGMVITANSAFHTYHIQDLTFSTGVAAGGTALNLTNNTQGGNFGQNDITRCTFRGDDGGGATDNWTTGIANNGFGNVNIDGCLFYGGSGASSVGAALNGVASGSFQYSIVVNITKCGFFGGLGTGFTYGQYVQGVTVNQCNFTNIGTGIWMPATAAGPTQLGVFNSQFNCSGNNILIQNPCPGVVLMGNLIYIAAGTAGLGVTGTSSSGSNTIIGNCFIGIGSPSTANTVGVNIDWWSTSPITGNVFSNLTTGVILGSHTTGINLQSNSYACVTPYTNAGTGNVIGGGSF